MSNVLGVRCQASVRALACLALTCIVLSGCEPEAADPDAGTDASGPCATDELCDDGLFCNGPERCAAGRCAAGTAPCAAAMCDESARTCNTDCDVDGDGSDAIACGGDDCDDQDAARAPGHPEVCDTAEVDEDCDATTFGDRDADGDGFASDACCNVAMDATRLCGDDCDDTRRDASPDVPDLCDAIDNDCDGMIDEGQLRRCFVDDDGDGYAPVGAAEIETCTCPVRTTTRPPTDADDCDDARPDVSPGLPEICGNGRDDDCDDAVDEAGNDWYRDCDGDGFGAGPAVRACVSPGTPGGCPGGGHVLLADDCDDATALVYPGAPEICDGVLNDCDGATADGPAATTWCSTRAPNIVAVCTSGACVFERCTTGFLDCGSAAGCETQGRTDVENCGACGNQCAPWGGVRTCVLGACGEPREIDAGRRHSCARRGSGAVVCWGSNSDRQLGDGTMTQRLTPTAVSGLSDAVEIATGGNYSCARRTSGAVVCWGIGPGGGATPTPIVALSDAVELAVGGYHACARRTSGAVVCWGNNSAGQVGDGTLIQRLTPTTVTGLTDAVEITAGERHTCARRASGTVVCWGHNVFGQIGDGSVVSERTTPTPVTGLTDAVELSAGGDHTCARRTSGSAVCWGANGVGQLGNGNTTTQRTPTGVSGLTDAVELAAGAAHTCARRASRVVLCWGSNASGELGDGTMTNRSTPAPVSGLTNAVELTAGSSHACARPVSGAVVCWGENGNGQLGDNTTTDRLTPTAVVAPL
jgi:alpha-tubulin suppressor-like RCC1 family protein